jgi:hypothetical protein
MISFQLCAESSHNGGGQEATRRRHAIAGSILVVVLAMIAAMAFSMTHVISNGLAFDFVVSLLWVHREPSGRRQGDSLQWTGTAMHPSFHQLYL